MSNIVDPDLLSAITIPPKSWVGVDLDCLERNIAAAQNRLARQSQLCAVIKSDAYGLGIQNIMPSLMRAGVAYVGVASNQEALAVRTSGYGGAILRVRPATPTEIELTIPLGIEELVGNLDSAVRLSKLASMTGKQVNVHISLNSNGMSRDGLEFDTENGGMAISNILHLPGLKIVGVMTHFADYELPKMLTSLRTFETETNWLFQNTLLNRQDVILHAAHSYSFLGLPESHLDLVRSGAALVGCAGEQPEFGHVMSLRSQVATISSFSKGNSVGYDRTKLLTRDSLLANIPLGYADGFSSSFSNKGEVLVEGQRAYIVGRISMNSLMVDVTDIEGVEAGDEVVLFGSQSNEQITQAEIETNSGTILAENYTNWGRANPRVLYRDE